MVDPRISIIDQRLKDVNRIIAVSSGKGGVGKSLIAAVVALTLARNGSKVGFFDLDFTSPSSHIILGLGDLRPEEEYGIVPPEVHELKYMSIVYYSGEHASPLRGSDISNVLIELLSVTIWPELDFLIIDMPPGISDATLDIIRLIKKAGFLIITTPSRLTFATVSKLIQLLSELSIPVIGVIENMKINDSKPTMQIKDIKFWGCTPFDSELEETIGNVDRLLETKFSKKIAEILKENLSL